MNGGPPRSTRTAHSFPTRRSSDLLAVEAFLIEGVEAGRRGPGQAAPEAPRVSGRESGRLDVARPRGAIVEMVDIARQAEVRIHVELAARRDEEIRALVLDPVESADRRHLWREQIALIVKSEEHTSQPQSQIRI